MFQIRGIWIRREEHYLFRVLVLGTHHTSSPKKKPIRVWLTGGYLIFYRETALNSRISVRVYEYDLKGLDNFTSTLCPASQPSFTKLVDRDLIQSSCNQTNISGDTILLSNCRPPWQWFDIHDIVKKNYCCLSPCIGTRNLTTAK